MVEIFHMHIVDCGRTIRVFLREWEKDKSEKNASWTISASEKKRTIRRDQKRNQSNKKRWRAEKCCVQPQLLLVHTHTRTPTTICDASRKSEEKKMVLCIRKCKLISFIISHKFHCSLRCGGGAAAPCYFSLSMSQYLKSHEKEKKKRSEEKKTQEWTFAHHRTSTK